MNMNMTNTGPSTPQQTRIHIDVLHTAKPVCITLRNQLLPNAKKNRKEFIALGRLSHLKPVLMQTRLEICTTLTHSSSDASDYEEETKILWSCDKEEALHPVWDHLDKQIKMFDVDDEEQYDESEGSEDFHNIYLNSFARVLVHNCSHSRNNDSISGSDQTHILDLNRSGKQTSLHKQYTNSDSDILAEIPLHPSNLRRLPAASSDFRKLSALPPNALIVEYTDGSVRVTPDFYSLLLKNGVITEEIMSANDIAHAQADLVEQKKREQRFNDDVFDTLGDSPSPSVYKVNGTKNRSVFEDDAFQLLGMKNLTQIEPRPSTHKRTHYIQNELEMDITPRQSDTIAEKLTIASRRSADQYFQNDILLKDLERQKLLLKSEEIEYEDEVIQLLKTKSSFHDTICKLTEIEKEIEALDTKARNEEENLSLTGFLLEARRIKMLKDLREIYPIQSLSNDRYAIRGLELPIGMNFVDDHVSSALGFTCHLVYMSSKYLSIPLRYRLICNASRSAVQDGDIVYPLFRTNTERPQFDRAVHLLEKDIECLLKLRGVQYLPRTHLLAKLDRLFIQTTEGGIFYHK